MTDKPSKRYLQVEHLGHVTVVKFRRREILDVAMIEAIGHELFQLVEEESRRHLLLNLSSVDRMSTAMIGKFVAAHQKARAADSQVAFCCMDAGIKEVFGLLRLTEVFTIYDDEHGGIEALRSKSGAHEPLAK